MGENKTQYERGDSVVLDGVGVCVVQQCFDGVGGWRVIAKGPWSRANPHGLYDFPVTLLRSASTQGGGKP